MQVQRAGAQAGCYARGSMTPCRVASRALGRRPLPLLVRAGRNGNGSGELYAELVQGRVTSGPDLSVTVNGLTFPNPFVIGSGPPGTNYQVMRKVSA